VAFGAEPLIAFGPSGPSRHGVRFRYVEELLTLSFALDALRIALAILLDTAALVVWNIGTRSPVRLFADVRAGLKQRSAVLLGLARFAIGVLAIAAAVAVSAAVASRAADFTVLECSALIVALVVEQLVGPDLRARRR
jgi:hypothetical protein